MADRKAGPAVPDECGGDFVAKSNAPSKRWLVKSALRDCPLLFDHHPLLKEALVSGRGYRLDIVGGRGGR